MSTIYVSPWSPVSPATTVGPFTRKPIKIVRKSKEDKAKDKIEGAEPVEISEVVPEQEIKSGAVVVTKS